MSKSFTYTESDLVKGCQGGNPAHQRALYEQHYRKMLGVCLRYTDDRQDAEDVLQDGFIRVFRNIGKFGSKGSLEGWIRRIMVNTSIELYRKKSRYFMVGMDEVKQQELQADQLSLLSRDELLALIQRLPAGFRTVFNLYAIEGFIHKEIAEMLGISVGTSKSQLSRARSLLREWIEKRENVSAVGY